jgi:hypothetical protein
LRDGPNPPNPLSKKFVESLIELDKIRDPALRALGRHAIARYYGIPDYSGWVIIGSWVLLIVVPLACIFLLGFVKTLLIETGLFIISIATICFFLRREGQLTERNFTSLLKICFKAMVQLPKIFVETFKEDSK